MKVDITLEEKLILRVFGYLQSKSAGRNMFILAMSVLVTIGVTIPVQDFLSKQNFFESAPAIIRQSPHFVVGCLVFLGAFKFLLAILRVPLFDADGSLLRPHELSIDSKGLHRKSSLETTFTDWRGIKKIEKYGDTLLFYTDNLAVYIAPEKAFASQKDADLFFSQALNYWHAAQETSNAPEAPWGHPAPHTPAPNTPEPHAATAADSQEKA